MGGKKKYIEMFGSFTEPFNYTAAKGVLHGYLLTHTFIQRPAFHNNLLSWYHNGKPCCWNCPSLSQVLLQFR